MFISLSLQGLSIFAFYVARNLFLFLLTMQRYGHFLILQAKSIFIDVKMPFL